jgi:FkbM family methyltransferase
MRIVNSAVARFHHLTQDRFNKKSYALSRMDFKLRKYLNFKRGFFIEAGANDGVDQSNTFYFEKYMKWRGLLVEPIPELAERCRANRPRSIVENYALVPFDYAQPYIEMRYCNLMSLVKGAKRTEDEELEHIQRGCGVQAVQTYELKVPTRTLSSILEQHSIRRIDLFSLDVEGFELSVLKGIDFDRHRPNFILVEANYRDEIDSFLRPMYEPVDKLSHHDVLYKSTKLIK